MRRDEANIDFHIVSAPYNQERESLRSRLRDCIYVARAVWDVCLRARRLGIPLGLMLRLAAYEQQAQTERVEMRNAMLGHWLARAQEGRPLPFSPYVR